MTSAVVDTNKCKISVLGEGGFHNMFVSSSLGDFGSAVHTFLSATVVYHDTVRLVDAQLENTRSILFHRDLSFGLSAGLTRIDT